MRRPDDLPMLRSGRFPRTVPKDRPAGGVVRRGRGRMRSGVRLEMRRDALRQGREPERRSGMPDEKDRHLCRHLTDGAQVLRLPPETMQKPLPVGVPQQRIARSGPGRRPDVDVVPRVRLQYVDGPNGRRLGAEPCGGHQVLVVLPAGFPERPRSPAQSLRGVGRQPHARGGGQRHEASVGVRLDTGEAVAQKGVAPFDQRAEQGRFARVRVAGSGSGSARCSPEARSDGDAPAVWLDQATLGQNTTFTENRAAVKSSGSQATGITSCM